MSSFALIANGFIAQIAAETFPVHESWPWVDITTTSPQPAEGWAATETDGAWTFSAPPAPPAPTLAQQAQAASSAGLTLTLSGSFTLAATLFPTDVDTQRKLGAVTTTINATGTFPGGTSTFPMKDSAGTWHTFTVAQYKAVAGAIAAYVAALYLIVDGNPLGVASLPASSESLTI